MEPNNDAATLAEELSEWMGTYTWRVKNWTKLTEEEIFSPDFEIGGYTWRLLVFPKGHDVHGYTHHISVYLDFLEVSFTPVHMYPRARFELMAVKVNAPEDSLKRETTYMFTNKATGWGFTQFMSIQEAQSPQNGYLVNDTLTLCVKIYLEEMDGVLGTISKLETGFMGIKSFKKTSLLSSYLQCLFHIKALRKLVFQMPTLPSDDPQKSVPLALQHLFYNLHYQNISAKTKDLIKALDWDCNDMCLQFNVPEIQHTLCDKLDKEDKANSIKNCISDLLLGEYSSYNECPTIPEAPIHKHTCKAIPLDVLDCRNVYASLEKFCQTMRFDEDNHYPMTSHGLRKSKKYGLFDSFPTFLQFNLKRCYYNPDRNVVLKMNSHYEFYDELDLDYSDRVLQSKNADTTTENKYRLHSVLVHRGGLRGGHYFAFIRPNKKWYKFDGEVVKAVSAEEAINAQFGDQNGTSSANFSKGFESINKSAAVMLIYIRKSEWNKVMCDVGKQYLPEQVRECFDRVRMNKDQEQKEKEAYLYVNIKLATESHFAMQKCERGYFDLVDFGAVKKYRIYKKTSFKDFKEMVSKDFGIPIHLQRFWLWSKRKNNAMRVSEPLTKSNSDIKTIFDLKDYRDKSSPPYQEKTALMTINLFLETPEGHSPRNKGILHTIQQNEFLIFVKYYDPASIELSYLGHLFVEKTTSVRSILKRAKKMAGLGLEDKVIGVEEVKHLPNVVCSDLLPEKRVSNNQMIQGDVIIIQKLVREDDFVYPHVRGFLESILSTQKAKSKST